MQALTKDQIKDNVANNFKYVRSQLKISQREMGERLGVSAKTMQQIEYGYAVAPHHVYSLSQLIKVSMDTIFCTKLSADNN